MTEAVAVSTMDLSWRKSSRGSQDGGNGDCVEVAFVERSVVVRDSTSPDQGMLMLPESTWTSLLGVSKL
jgi:hypothetical protein